MNKPKLANVLGIVGALSLPAVVVAQQFNPNQPLRAQDLQSLVDRVAALEEGTGPSAQRFATITADGSTAYTARSDGFVVTRPGGSGFTAAIIAGSFNASEASRAFRSRDGDTSTMIVSRGDVLTLFVEGLPSTASVQLLWFPLRRNGPTPTCAGGCNL